MNVSVIGLGYIGLPTAAILASRGVNVFGVDTNPHIVKTINEGKIHIVEPGLEALVAKSVRSRKLKADSFINKSDVFIISVPTPFHNNYEPDLSYIKLAIANLAKVLESGNLIILESTCPVGTSEKISKWLSEIRNDLTFPTKDSEIPSDIAIAYCPERVIPGNIITEIVNNDRIIGGISENCSIKAKNLYQLFVEGECITTNARTAEMCKLAENSYRDINIAYANELAKICDELNINSWELISFANRHPRVNILKPGPGVGGHCIAVDPWFIVSTNPQSSILIRSARQINGGRPDYVFDRIIKTINNSGLDISKTKVLTLGLSYKPNVDDIRESPALLIAEKVAHYGFAMHYVVEPNLDSISDLFKNTDTKKVELEYGLNNAHVILVLVDHNEFKEINFNKLTNAIIIDIAGINV
jgi:UDP-N-acetyl-D-mannosaminuronic acid dehydrogenase